MNNQNHHPVCRRSPSRLARTRRLRPRRTSATRWPRSIKAQAANPATTIESEHRAGHRRRPGLCRQRHRGHARKRRQAGEREAADRDPGRRTEPGRHLTMNALGGRQRGIVAVMVAIGLLALLAMVGLALDSGHAVLNKSRLQNTVDASALAAAKVLDSTRFRSQRRHGSAQRLRPQRRDQPELSQRHERRRPHDPVLQYAGSVGPGKHAGQLRARRGATTSRCGPASRRWSGSLKRAWRHRPLPVRARRSG